MLLTLAGGAAAQKPKALDLFAFVEHTRYGYIDASGKVVIAPQFYDAWSFSDGLGRVTVESRCVHIDRTGKIAIRPQGYAPHGFSEGLAQARIGAQWGYTGTSGKTALPPRFEMARGF